MADAGNARAQIPGPGAWPIIVILAVLGSLSAAARGQNTSPQILLEKALENARSITNIEIQYDDVLWIKGKPISAAESNEFTRTMKTSYPFSEDYTRTCHITYTASGGKYRTESRNESPQSTNIIKFEQTTFDGRLWSELNGSSGYMVEQDGDMPGDKHNPACPLIAQFLFLSKDSDDCFPCGLRFTDLHSPDILNGLILPEAENSNGVLHLSFHGLPRNGVNQLWNITMDASDPDFTPRNISRIIYAGSRAASATEGMYTFLTYTNIGAYRFPTKIGYRHFDVPTNNLLAPTLAATGMVTVVSVKIPAQIPDSTFRADESKASNVWNMGETKGYGVGLILGEAGSNIVVKRIVPDSPAGRQKELQASTAFCQSQNPIRRPLQCIPGRGICPGPSRGSKAPKGPPSASPSCLPGERIRSPMSSPWCVEKSEDTFAVAGF